jgi:hypothetical protein
MPDPRTISIQIPQLSHTPLQSRAATFPAARDLHPSHSPHHPIRRTPWIIQLRIHRLQPTPSPHPRTGTQHHANSQNNHRLQQCHGVYIFDFVVSIRPGHGMTSPPQVPLHYDTPTFMALPKCRLVCSGTPFSHLPPYSPPRVTTAVAHFSTPTSMARRMLH